MVVRNSVLVVNINFSNSYNWLRVFMLLENRLRFVMCVEDLLFSLFYL